MTKEVDDLRKELQELTDAKQVFILRRQVAKLKKDEAHLDHLPTPLRTVGDMLSALETLYNNAEMGLVDEGVTRNLIRIRNAQLKTAELQMQYRRLHKGHLPPDPELLLATQPGNDEERPLTLDELAQLGRLNDRKEKYGTAR